MICDSRNDHKGIKMMLEAFDIETKTLRVKINLDQKPEISGASNINILI